jgi:GNAT superfamily N-acetyltransferase
MPFTESSTPSILIREASLNDVPELARLRWDFCGGNLTRHDLQKFTAGFHAFITERLHDPGWTIIVGEGGENLVGMVYLQKILRLPRPDGRSKSFAYVSNLHVDRHFRGHGLRRGLVEQAMEWAREQRISALLVGAGEQNPQVYERLGFRRLGQHLQLGLRS